MAYPALKCKVQFKGFPGFPQIAAALISDCNQSMRIRRHNGVLCAPIWIAKECSLTTRSPSASCYTHTLSVRFPSLACFEASHCPRGDHSLLDYHELERRRLCVENLGRGLTKTGIGLLRRGLGGHRGHGASNVVASSHELVRLLAGKVDQSRSGWLP